MADVFKIVKGPSRDDLILSLAAPDEVHFTFLGDDGSLGEKKMGVCITAVSSAAFANSHMAMMRSRAESILRNGCIDLYVRGDAFLVEGIVMSNPQPVEYEEKEINSLLKCYMFYAPQKRRGIVSFRMTGQYSKARGDDLLRLAWGGQIFGNLGWMPIAA